MSIKVGGFIVSRYYFCAGLMLALGLAAVKGGPVAELSFGVAVLFWALHILVGVCVYVFSTQVLMGLFSSTTLNTFLASSLISAPIFGSVALFLEMPFFKTQLTFSNIVSEIYPASTQSFVFWILINLPLFFSSSTPSRIDDSHSIVSKERSANQSVSVLQDLIRIRGDAPIYIRAEANYIRVFFKERDDLVLYRLKDAVKELPFGIQVHRSYWVNLNEKIERIYVNKVPYILINNRAKIPVGRKFFFQVKRLKNSSHN